MAQEEEKLHNWDSVIIQINLGEDAVGNIQMMKIDLENMMELQKCDRGEILEMMISALETTPKNAV